ncbi:hypothetical protein K458DRAFT_74774 [Lentithecium fluviatile CBS 122367]|uniref:Uncharacterized protein n=1 Tax=Lentithecium fluviatile CBS 122367 TaxID=1168545 RepID=A0A6G1IUE3_9PLEO|nr:hypothetical protein K458DRAFT_74774 [Lentithecium fluviatile CBS 122367]
MYLCKVASYAPENLRSVVFDQITELYVSECHLGLLPKGSLQRDLAIGLTKSNFPKLRKLTVNRKRMGLEFHKRLPMASEVPELSHPTIIGGELGRSATVDFISRFGQNVGLLVLQNPNSYFHIGPWKSLLLALPKLRLKCLEILYDDKFLHGLYGRHWVDPISPGELYAAAETVFIRGSWLKDYVERHHEVLESVSSSGPGIMSKISGLILVGFDFDFV